MYRIGTKNGYSLFGTHGISDIAELDILDIYMDLENDILELPSTVISEVLKVVEAKMMTLIDIGKKTDTCSKHVLRCTDLYLHSMDLKLRLDRFGAPFSELPWLDTLVMIFRDVLVNNQNFYYYLIKSEQYDEFLSSIKQAGYESFTDFIQTADDLSICHDFLLTHNLIEQQGDAYFINHKMEILFPGVYKELNSRNKPILI